MKGVMSFFVLAMALCMTGVSYAQSQKETGKYYTTGENVAVEGYDVVGYFNQNLAIRGSKDHSAEYDGVIYYFSSEDNKKAFLANPEKYLPQYGGWCAFAMAAKNTKFPPDPKTFKLYNGKLLLFYNGEFGNTSVPWNSDEKNMVKQADSNWATMNANAAASK